MRRLFCFAPLLAVSLLLPSCSESSAPPKPAVAAKPAPPSDERAKFPSAGQTKMELVPEKLLGRDFLPGGNLAEYETKKGRKYQQFLLKAKDPQAAALLLFDFKNSLTQTKYIAYMGGYTGDDKGQPVYVFAKGPYLAGFIGLPEAEADVLARQFAARL